ncbi:MAG: hypothetical protein QF535_19090 [Anaerolineales bacterium]|nr:hypothetical protein [Anaerolineales bacterium]
MSVNNVNRCVTSVLMVLLVLFVKKMIWGIALNVKMVRKGIIILKSTTQLIATMNAGMEEKSTTNATTEI